jgi:hypothetical protein
MGYELSVLSMLCKKSEIKNLNQSFYLFQVSGLKFQVAVENLKPET